ncbi:hypothetical protein DFO66_10720 [Brevibacterium sanguinis]|uniref:Uncharacterized protein n=2 Tax=Brevibacterium TaxID=1696 RepID=A0A366IJU6_9MICO|nr:MULTISPECIES: hypothetical protein [Brevibacterium]RBP64148.1 hypothetical protein DFO66_10720 [Brevibacterium sanguinis]RBP71560.1 hypothetical protein DFO65_105164 [Brevibacterium celere]
MLTAKQLYRRLEEGRIDDLDNLADHLGYAWMRESYYPEDLLGQRKWIELFRAVGYVVNGIRTPMTRLPRVIYRTAVPEEVDRMSWTADKATAQALVTNTLYPREDRVVWVATCKPEAVLARFDDDPDRVAQILVDPLMLDDIEPAPTRPERPARARPRA